MNDSTARLTIHLLGAPQVQVLDEDECDVTRFRRLLSAGGESALAQAVALYRGPLLQGFTLADAPLFEDWVRFEEARLVGRQFARCVTNLVGLARQLFAL